VHELQPDFPKDDYVRSNHGVENGSVFDQCTAKQTAAPAFLSLENFPREAQRVFSFFLWTRDICARCRRWERFRAFEAAWRRESPAYYIFLGVGLGFWGAKFVLERFLGSLTTSRWSNGYMRQRWVFGGMTLGQHEISMRWRNAHCIL
jgi:hypothetical protein